MISITSAPAAPPPRIRILDPSGGDVETVRIGDRLVFRIEIPGNSNTTDLIAPHFIKLINLFACSSLRHLCPQLHCHGQGFEKYVPDYRR